MDLKNDPARQVAKRAGSKTNTRNSSSPTRIQAETTYGCKSHLKEELLWLNRLLAARALQLRQNGFYERFENFRGLFVSDEEVDSLLFDDLETSVADERSAIQTKLDKLQSIAHNLRNAIDRNVAELAKTTILPLYQLRESFGLTNFEYQTLVICMAPHIDARYERLYSYLQNDYTKRVASVDLVLNLLTPDLEKQWQDKSYFHRSAALRINRLVELNENGSGLSEQFLYVDRRIIAYALGNNLPDERLLSYFHLRHPLDWEKIVVDSNLRSLLQRLFSQGLERERETHQVIYLSGARGTGKKTLVQALCGDYDIRCGIVDFQHLLSASTDFIEHLVIILREALLQPCVLYFDHFDVLDLNDKNSLYLRSIIDEIRRARAVVFIGSNTGMPEVFLDLQNVYPLEIPKPDFRAQQDLWRLYLNGFLSKNETFDLEQLASQFDLTGGQITRVVQLARQTLLTRKPEADPPMTLEDILESGHHQSQPNLSTLARRISPHYIWQDIVLPPDQLLQLRELANQVKNKHIVFKKWGFERKLSLGHGLTALFAGPSGTGKTMAAEVIANEVGLPLFKIELSAVVSKYIGETEKNLNRIFNEAVNSNSILFFDEADALLGKRSEVKDAHDRYANIEVAYLLQKMEEYKGVTILATNFRRNIDEAFTRRIRFIIEFPFPDKTSRFEIWRRIWPEEIPMHRDLDLGFMARQFRLAGGNIRNVALNAAFLAAQDDSPVNMKNVILATRREYQKIGKLCDKADFGRYFSLLESEPNGVRSDK